MRAPDVPRMDQEQFEANGENWVDANLMTADTVS